MSLVLEGVGIFVGSSLMFRKLDLEVRPGEVATIQAASGAGKSSLLAGIGGHLDQELGMEGKIWLNSHRIDRIASYKRRVGIMFQEPMLFPHLSVAGNLAFGLSASFRTKAARQQKISEALERCGLSGMEKRDPATLSGGQKSRIALMRTLLAEPLALLLDEPFSSLDQERRAELREFVFSEIRMRNIPALMVSHDPEDAQAANGPLLSLEPPP